MKFNLFMLLGICALTVALSACNLADGASKRVQAPPPSDEIAAFVSTGAQGQSTYIYDSRFGEGTAILGDSYISAMGAACRRVTFNGRDGRRQALAVCAEPDGSWSTAPQVFDQPPQR